MKCSYIKSAFLTLLILGLASQTQAATKAAGVIDDGYAGKVLQKILDTGKVNINQRLDVRLTLDDQGRLTDCSAIKGTDAKGVCSAIKTVSPFGTPPYGVPVSIVIALWPGNGATQAKQEKPATQATQSAPSDKYLEQIRKQIRNSIYIPEKTRPGTYRATVHIRLDKNGNILDSSLLKGSGDKLLDKYVLQGITRAAKVAPPPAGKDAAVDLTFTLVRQK